MSRRKRDDEVTQTLRVGREALAEALRESQRAAKRVQSSVPPPDSTRSASDEPSESDESERETQP